MATNLSNDLKTKLVQHQDTELKDANCWLRDFSFHFRPQVCRAEMPGGQLSKRQLLYRCEKTKFQFFIELTINFLHWNELRCQQAARACWSELLSKTLQPYSGRPVQCHLYSCESQPLWSCLYSRLGAFAT